MPWESATSKRSHPGYGHSHAHSHSGSMGRRRNHNGAVAIVFGEPRTRFLYCPAQPPICAVPCSPSAAHSVVCVVFADVVPTPLPLRTKSCPLLTVKPASIHRNSNVHGPAVALPSTTPSHGAGLKFSPIPTFAQVNHRNSHPSMLPHIPSLGDSQSHRTHPVVQPRGSEHRANYTQGRFPRRSSSSEKQASHTTHTLNGYSAALIATVHSLVHCRLRLYGD